MTTTCAHLALAESAEGWGSCPDCGQMENAVNVRRDIAERLGLYTEDQYQEVIDDSHQQGWQDGKDAWWDAATDAYDARMVEWVAPRLDGLSGAIEVIAGVLDAYEEIPDDEGLDAAIAHLWEVHDALDRREWEQ